MNYKWLYVLLVLSFCLPVFPAAGENNDAFELVAVKFKGVKHVNRKTLSKTLTACPPSRLRFWVPKPVLTEDDLIDDLQKIKQYYQAYGYFHVAADYRIRKIKNLDRKTGAHESSGGTIHPVSPTYTAKVVFSVTEGVPVLVESIDLQIKDAPAVFSKFDFVSQLPLKENAPFEIGKYKESKVIIKQLLGNKGYPYVKLVSKGSVDLEENTASVIYDIHAGPRCTFGDLEIPKDLLPVKKVIIKRAVTIKTGELYETRKVAQSQRNLYNLDIFKSAQIRAEQLAPGENVVPMMLTLKPKKRQSVKLGIGYGSEDSVRLKGGWTYRNLGIMLFQRYWESRENPPERNLRMPTRI